MCELLDLNAFGQDSLLVLVLLLLFVAGVAGVVGVVGVGVF